MKRSFTFKDSTEKLKKKFGKEKNHPNQSQSTSIGFTFPTNTTPIVQNPIVIKEKPLPKKTKITTSPIITRNEIILPLFDENAQDCSFNIKSNSPISDCVPSSSASPHFVGFESTQPIEMNKDKSKPGLSNKVEVVLIQGNDDGDNSDHSISLCSDNEIDDEWNVKKRVCGSELVSNQNSKEGSKMDYSNVELQSLIDEPIEIHESEEIESKDRNEIPLEPLNQNIPPIRKTNQIEYYFPILKKPEVIATRDIKEVFEEKTICSGLARLNFNKSQKKSTTFTSNDQSNSPNTGINIKYNCYVGKHVHPLIKIMSAYDVIAILSPKGTGKTWITKQYLIEVLTKNPDLKVLSLSHRRTLINFLTDSLNKETARGLFDGLNFVNYQSVNGSLYAYTRVIVCINSILRLLKDKNVNSSPIKVYDLLIIDEFKGLIRSFDDPNLSKDRTSIVNIFKVIVRSAKKIIITDADFDMNGLIILTKILGENELIESKKKFYFSKNLYRNDPNTYYFIKDSTVFYDNLVKRALMQKVIILPTNCLRSGERCKKILKHYGIKVFLLKGKNKTNNPMANPENWVKKDPDTGRYVSRYQVFIFSPVMVSGVSIEYLFFDELHAHFTIGSCGVDDCTQMLSRVRTLNEKRCFIYAGKSSDHGELKESHLTYSIKEHILDVNVTISYTNEQSPSSAFSENSLSSYNEIMEDLYTHIDMSNKMEVNVSSSEFSSGIRKKISGYTIEESGQILEYNDFLNSPDSIGMDDLLQEDVTVKDVMREISEESLEMIVSAPNVYEQKEDDGDDDDDLEDMLKSISYRNRIMNFFKIEELSVDFLKKWMYRECAVCNFELLYLFKKETVIHSDIDYLKGILKKNEEKLIKYQMTGSKKEILLSIFKLVGLDFEEPKSIMFQTDFFDLKHLQNKTFVYEEVTKECKRLIYADQKYMYKKEVTDYASLKKCIKFFLEKIGIEVTYNRTKNPKYDSKDKNSKKSIRKPKIIVSHFKELLSILKTRNKDNPNILKKLLDITNKFNSLGL